MVTTFQFGVIVHLVLVTASVIGVFYFLLFRNKNSSRKIPRYKRQRFRKMYALSWLVVFLLFIALLAYVGFQKSVDFMYPNPAFQVVGQASGVSLGSSVVTGAAEGERKVQISTSSGKLLAVAEKQDIEGAVGGKIQVDLSKMLRPPYNRVMQDDKLNIDIKLNSTAQTPESKLEFEGGPVTQHTQSATGTSKKKTRAPVELVPNELIPWRISGPLLNWSTCFNILELLLAFLLVLAPISHWFFGLRLFPRS